MTPAELEIRECVMEGMAVELIPDPEGGYYLRIGILNQTISGVSAAACFLALADILSAPMDEGRGEQ